MSCDLEEGYFAIFILVRLGIIRWLFGLPSKKDVIEAAKSLIYLSNSVGDKSENREPPKKLKEEADKVNNLLLTGNIKKLIDKVQRF